MFSDPLVPQPLSGASKFATYGSGTIAFLFVLATFIMTLIEGAKPGHHGFIILGIALILLLCSVLWFLRWVREDQSLDDKLKWLAIGQVICTVLLSVAIWIAMFEPQPSDIPPQLCELGPLYSQNPNTCFAISQFPHCFATNQAPYSAVNQYVCLGQNMCTNCTYL